MTDGRAKLPRAAWRRIYRVTGLITAVSVALSVVLSNLFMEGFSQGLNVQGLLVAVALPVALGAPSMFLLTLKHEQLRDANARLAHLASTDGIRAALRPGDLIGRLGGEEFGVYLPNTDPMSVTVVAERIRRLVAAIRFEPEGKACPLSVSIGGAIHIGQAAFGDLYRRADQHLYQAKDAGRDRVAIVQAA